MSWTFCNKITGFVTSVATTKCQQCRNFQSISKYHILFLLDNTTPQGKQYLQSLSPSMTELPLMSMKIT